MHRSHPPRYMLLDPELRMQKKEEGREGKPKRAKREGGGRRRVEGEGEG